MAKKSNRPEGYSGALDEHLSRVQAGLVRDLTKAQKDFQRDTLRFPATEVKTLASALVEFAEDIHTGAGIWLALERYQQEFFGTPLPFVLGAGDGLEPDQIAPERCRYFLWVLYAQMKPGLILSPDHADLVRLAASVAATLHDHFDGLPRDSGVKAFLGAPIDHGWEVKRKLIWLGTRSYLFRLMFANFVSAQEGKRPDIATIDDFVCQEATEWSGLGVPDILAGALDLTPERRSDLRSWYERHAAVFKVVTVNPEVMEVRNLVCERSYRVRIGADGNSFTRGMIIVGSLVPWDGEWLWSGAQQVYKHLGSGEVKTLVDGYRRVPTICYRYCKDDLKRAREILSAHLRDYVAKYGKDWVVYPDGLAMAAAWQEEARRKIEALPDRERKTFLKKHGLSQPRPEITLPPDLLEARDGIGVYFNPEEGQEIMTGFNTILSGLQRRGVRLTRDEAGAIEGWVQSREISPGFVRGVTAEFGPESVLATFLLDQRGEPYTLDYLLRRFKGVFYRNRYPTLTVVE